MASISDALGNVIYWFVVLGLEPFSDWLATGTGGAAPARGGMRSPRPFGNSLVVAARNLMRYSTSKARPALALDVSDETVFAARGSCFAAGPRTSLLYFIRAFPSATAVVLRSPSNRGTST